MGKTEIISRERDILRSELRDLKNCQVRYFSISITATGIILGYAFESGVVNLPNVICLAPLFILLPSWLIFFDKATTITRIVGYVRIIEYILSHENQTVYRYVGWENALDEFREKQKVSFSDAMRGLWKLVTLRTTHRYWMITWATFLALSVVSWLLGSGAFWGEFTISKLLLIEALLPGISTLLVLLNTLYLLSQLVGGSYSYEASSQLWDKVAR